MNRESNPNPGQQEKNRLTLNILKLVFLVTVLIAAWFLLDWIINR